MNNLSEEEKNEINNKINELEKKIEKRKNEINALSDMDKINSYNEGHGYITSKNDPELKYLEEQLKMEQNKLGGKRWWPFSSGGRRYKKKRSTKRKKSAKRRTRRS